VPKSAHSGYTGDTRNPVCLGDELATGYSRRRQECNGLCYPPLQVLMVRARWVRDTRLAR
jgi:hypothetical protein